MPPIDPSNGQTTNPPVGGTGPAAQPVPAVPVPEQPAPPQPASIDPAAVAPVASGVLQGPAPTPTAVTPAAQPQSFVTGSGIQTTDEQNRKSKRLKLAVIGVVAAVVLAAGGFFGYTAFFGGLALEEYDGDGFSMQVPKGYEKENQSGFVLFKQPDVGKDKESGVGVGKMPGSIPDSQRDRVLDEIEKSMESGSESLADAFGDGDTTLKSVKTERKKHNGNDAVSVSADVFADDKKAGSFKASYIMTDKNELYVIVAAAHESNPRFGKKVDTIINSFKLD